MKKLTSNILVVVFVSCISLNTLASTITVNWDGTGDFLTIQSAINEARNGDTIIVMAGTYVENIILKNGVAIVGEGGDKCIIDGGSNGPVIYSTWCNSQTILKNFTITNGSGYINQNNRSLGGGMYNNHSNPTITYCIFTENSVEYGGGIYNDNRSDPEISHCLFTENVAKWWGGAIVNYHYSNPKIFNCAFIKNTARYGGGIYNYNFCNAEIKNCIFEKNIATSEIYYSCGGGVFNDKESNPLIANSIFIDNTVSDSGGGLYNRSSSPIVINCTFNGNWANLYGGAIGNFKESYPMVSNCILWKNRANLGGDEVYNIEDSRYGSCIPYFSYCNISLSGGSGANWDISIGIDEGKNIDADPLFVNSAENNYHLTSNSSCIDTGDPDSEIQPGETDLDSNPRIINGIVDMGAYEFVPNTAPVADAGDDILAYAGLDGTATVKLDGSGSFDADDDLLEYFWFNDADELIAKGVDPNVVLAAGVHVIELVVDDSMVSSEPNSVVVTVIEAIEARAYVFPRVLNTTSRGRYVIARMELPDGISKDDFESDSLVLIIGDTVIESIRQRRISSRGQDYVFGFFDRGRVIAQADGKTKLDIVIAGELTTGQCIYGEDSIKIVKSQASQKKTLRRMPARNNRGGRR